MSARMDRRTYAREYARRRYERKLAEQQRTARTCPRKFGRYGVCGAVLESDTVAGSLVVWCPRCERLRQGICADCPAPVAGTRRKARYCALHKKLRTHESTARHRQNNRRAVKARERARYRAEMKAMTPEQRAERAALKKAWRQANPRKVKAQKHRENLRASERRNEYHRQYREARKAERAARELDRYYGRVAERTCIVAGCPSVLTGRAKKCEPCKARDRAEARAILEAHYASVTGHGSAA